MLVVRAYENDEPLTGEIKIQTLWFDPDTSLFHYRVLGHGEVVSDSHYTYDWKEVAREALNLIKNEPSEDKENEK